MKLIKNGGKRWKSENKYKNFKNFKNMKLNEDLPYH